MPKFNEVYSRGARIPPGLNYQTFSRMEKFEKGALLAGVFEAKSSGKALTFMGRKGKVLGKTVEIASIAMIPFEFARGEHSMSERYGSGSFVQAAGGVGQAILPLGPADSTGTWDMSHQELLETNQPGFPLLFESLANPTSPRWIPWMVYKGVFEP